MGENTSFLYTVLCVSVATGFAAAVSISSAILSGNEDVLLGYRTFLKSGGSIRPYRPP